MHRNWRWNLHGHISLLPFTLLYAVFCFVVYGARSWGFRNGVIVAIGGHDKDGRTRIWGNPGAQTIGMCQVYADSVQINRPDLHVHENVHCAQQMLFAIGGLIVTPVLFVVLGWPAWLGLALGGTVGGAAFAISYGACFLFAWAVRGFGPWHDAYHAIPFEVQAYARQAEWLGRPKEQRAEVWS